MRQMGVTGIDELQKKLRRNATMVDVKNVVKTNTSELQRNMQRNAPVDTGNMKRSVNVSIINSGLSAIVEPTADYSPYVEYGTRFNIAQPFVRPAFMRQKYQFLKDMNRLVK